MIIFGSFMITLCDLDHIRANPPQILNWGPKYDRRSPLSYCVCIQSKMQKILGLWAMARAFMERHLLWLRGPPDHPTAKAQPKSVGNLWEGPPALEGDRLSKGLILVALRLIRSLDIWRRTPFYRTRLRKGSRECVRWRVPVSMQLISCEVSGLSNSFAAC